MDRLFIGEIKKQLYIRRWNYKKLSEETHIPKGTIEQFMSGRDDDRTAKAIARVLEIEM